MKESLQSKRWTSMNSPSLGQKSFSSNTDIGPGCSHTLLWTPINYSLWPTARASSCLDSVHCMKESLQPKRWTAHNCTLLEVFQQTIFLLMDYLAIFGHEGPFSLTWVGQFDLLVWCFGRWDFMKANFLYSRGFFLKTLALCTISIQEWFIIKSRL